ncbi:MAG TPA: hypothetical protein VE964_15940 [Myxococcales bacterium]|nr:hypothetical protein [Myxococcales bacterium]
MLDSTERKLLALLLVASGWLFVYFDRLNNPNELVRVYMARAMLEQGTYAIGERRAVPGGFRDSGPVYSEWGYVNDKALVCDDPRARPPACAGKLYAAKAPGASFLAVPVLAALKLALGREPSRTQDVFVLRWVFCIVPTALFWLAMRRFLLRSGAPPAAALACVLAGALGSLSYTYGQMFAGHQLAALSLGTAFLIAFWPRGSTAIPTVTPTVTPTSAIFFGLASALAILFEYPSTPATLLLAAFWLWHRRPPPRAVALAALGALPPLLALAHFHSSAFGAPWSTPYTHLENPQFIRDIAPGFLGISLPTWERVQGSLFSPYLGLFFWAPWTALSLGAAPLLLRRRHPAGTAAVAVVAYYLLFQITHALWRSGWVVGPRYLTPLVPFAAAAVGLAVAQLPWAARPWGVALLGGAGAASIAATGLASIVCQAFPIEVYNPLVEVVAPLLSHGYVPRNLLQLAGVPGLWSALPALAALAAGMALLLTAPLRIDPRARRPHRLALATFALLVLSQWTATSGDAPAHSSAVRYLSSIWQPDPPPGARPFSLR